MTRILIALLLVFTTRVFSQSEELKRLPFYEIPTQPSIYTTGTVAARMVDGLGFRYYWATDGLRDEDLNFKPSSDARTTIETIDHIYGLSKFIRNSLLDNNKDNSSVKLDFESKRIQTLMNLKVVSDALRNIEEPYDLNGTDIPFWNIINGPIADALWHCGQVVLLRRSSGNPFNPKVDVFSGKLRE